jgi:hypothetical protein
MIQSNNKYRIEQNKFFLSVGVLTKRNNVHHFFFPILHCIAVVQGMDIEVFCKLFFFIISKHSAAKFYIANRTVSSFNAKTQLLLEKMCLEKTLQEMIDIRTS